MEEWGSYHNRFVRISREMPNHTARQISEHWRNSLNPDLCHDPLSINEKNFIIGRVRKEVKERRKERYRSGIDHDRRS
ncbi:unnamed protein product [Rhizophagus irregularis]|nr:unnamed protein product [Rhizophagus irregularis]CAB4408544.1 unnamed protein product [Rhizophagus irregularis]